MTSTDVIDLDAVKVRVLPDGRLSRKHAAAYLGLSDKTLAIWSTEGRGPRPVKVGGRVFYFKSELDAFIGEGGDYAA